MIESFPATNVYTATEMANKKIKELRGKYKPIQINTTKDGTKKEPSFSVVVLFELQESI